MEVNDGMTKPRLAPEVLAALIDGTLDPEARRSALEVIANSPADYLLFVETTSVLAELDDAPEGEVVYAPQPAVDDVAPAAPPPARRVRWLPVALAVAAGLAAVAILTRDRNPAGATVLAQVTAVAAGLVDPAAGSLDRNFGPGWYQGLAGTRGSGGSSAAAFRVGVALVDFQVATVAGDSVAGVQAGRTLVRELRQVERGGPAGALAEVALATPSPGAIGGVVAAVEGLFAADRGLEEGAWLETFRLAALAGRLDAVLAGPQVKALLSRWSARGFAVSREVEGLAGRRDEAPGVLRRLVDSLGGR